MSKNFLLSLALLLTGFLSFGQLYTKPIYPQGYFRWVTNLKPDIVANMGELRTNHWHMGLDVRTNQVVNQNVVSAADGYIAFVGIEPFSWGRWIIINHPNGLSTLYGHLNNFRDDLEKYVTEKQYENESWVTHLNIPPGRFPVKKGEFISFSGTTGGSGGPHVHWEVIDTKSGRRLNPTLFGTPITDNIAPTILKIAMYDRNNSVYDQNPSIYSLTKSGGIYSVAGGIINTNLNNLSFSIQAYDTRNGTSNQDGIYSARLFVDEKEISSFYIDSIDYADSRYMNCQVDYKMKANGGSWMQHTSKLPGDMSGVYYDLGENGTIGLNGAEERAVRIEVGDADGNISRIQFKVKNNGSAAPATRNYLWAAGRQNNLLNANFEAYLPLNALYDRMNPGYSSAISSLAGSVSALHTLGQTNVPVHSFFEIRIKPDKPINPENRDRIVIKRTGKSNTVQKATWNGQWLTARFRDFGAFEAFIDNVPPTIPSLGSGEIVNLNNASRISFTPTDNYGIDDFRAELDGEWLRFTNDKGRTWVYNFDNRVTPGQHTLTVTVTDIAGNVTRKSWKFIRGVNPPPAAAAPSQPVNESKKPVVNKTTVTKKADTKASGKTGNKTSSKPAAKSTGKKSATTKTPAAKKETASGKKAAATKSAPATKKTTDKKPVTSKNSTKAKKK